MVLSKSWLMVGEPLVHKVAMVAKYGVFPAAMLASVIYSPPRYSNPKKSSN